MTADSMHNAFRVDWDGDGTYSPSSGGGSADRDDARIATAAGVFFRAPTGIQSFPQPSLDQIGNGDGTGQTLMLSENLQAGNWAGRAILTNSESDRFVNSLGFGVPITLASGRPSAAQPDGRIGAAGSPLSLQAGYGLSDASGDNGAINSNPSAAVGSVHVRVPITPEAST